MLVRRMAVWTYPELVAVMTRVAAVGSVFPHEAEAQMRQESAVMTHPEAVAVAVVMLVAAVSRTFRRDAEMQVRQVAVWVHLQSVATAMPLVAVA